MESMSKNNSNNSNHQMATSANEIKRSSVSEAMWYEQYTKDFGKSKISSRPSMIPWYLYYIQNLNLSIDRGNAFAKRAVKAITELLQENLSTLQDLVLSGDVETTCYQIARERGRQSGKRFKIMQEHSLLHFAVLVGNKELVAELIKEAHKDVKLREQKLSEKSKEESDEQDDKEEEQEEDEEQLTAEEWVNKGDLITGFTALHFAFFTQNPILMALLIENGADVSRKDQFFATPVDFGRMLRLLPSQFPVPKIKAWNTERKQVDELTIQQFEKEIRVRYCGEITVSDEYIEELMFSGINIASVDLEVRKKYTPLIYETTGDENLVLARINDAVGFGVFAAKDFQPGDFIVRYGGKLVAAAAVKDRTYAMASGIEGICLDGKYFRNLGGMINHSADANAESQCFFDRGAEQAIITAKTFIPKGHQVFIDYSHHYWTKRTMKETSLQDLNEVPSLPL